MQATTNDHATFKAQVWVSKEGNYKFAEQDSDWLAGRPNTGVCFSGGGTRALSAAMGQLRGLTHLGLIEKIRYISCVSGGGWASIPYTYYRSGPSNDEQFLGPIIEPQEITMAGLGELDESCLGHCANQSLLLALGDAFFRGIAPHRLWIESIGELFLKPFGLHDTDHPVYFTLDDNTAQKIKARNPALSNAMFYTVRHKRPYLIINSCIIGPESLLPLAKLDLVGFHYTPLYLGSPFAKPVTYQPKFAETVSKWVGGGFIEPFAFGGLGKIQLLANSSQADAPDQSTVVVQQADKPFTLAEAAGTSSAAFVSTLVSWVKSITSPQEQYWPLIDSGEQATDTFSFGDGGHLDNYGLITLLQRKVETIIVFINSVTKLNLEYDPTMPPGKDDIDYSLGPLFGYPGKDMPQNQVFDQADFIPLIHDLQQAKREGRTIMSTTDLTVQANTWWGVEGGWQVKICWVYNDRVMNWEKQLSPEIHLAIEEGNHRSRALDEMNEEALPALDEMSLEEWNTFTAELENFWPVIEDMADDFLTYIENELDKGWKEFEEQFENQSKKGNDHRFADSSPQATFYDKAKYHVLRLAYYLLRTILYARRHAQNAIGVSGRKDKEGQKKVEQELEKRWERLEEMRNQIWNTSEETSAEEATEFEEEFTATALSFPKSSPFGNFPNYNTIGQNSWSVVRLTKPQINLLAHLSCWNITENADRFRQLLVSG